MNLRIDSFSPTTNARENSRKRKWKVAVGSINILKGHDPRVLFSFYLSSLSNLFSVFSSVR